MRACFSAKTALRRPDRHHSRSMQFTGMAVLHKHAKMDSHKNMFIQTPFVVSTIVMEMNKYSAARAVIKLVAVVATPSNIAGTCISNSAKDIRFSA